MKVSMLRKISIAIASLVASSTAFGAMDMDSRVTQLENQMQQVRTETAMETYGAQTATARADIDGYGLSLTLDVLYWNAKSGGTEFAYSDEDPRASLPISGETKDIGSGWDWGLRFGLGYNLAHDGWDMQAQYTWFDAKRSGSSGAGINGSIVPLKGSASIVKSAEGSETFKFCTEAKSAYRLDFNALDFEIGRAYFISKKLSFRPHCGLKTAWIDQDQTTRYSGGNPSNTNLGLQANTVEVKDESDFWGLGPRFGIDSSWHLGYGFSIFGNIAGALLLGKFDVEHKESYSAPGFENNKIKIRAGRRAFSPSAQMQLGLRYDTCLHNNKQHLGVGLGFEGQYWWRQNQMIKIDDSDVLKYERYSEDLGLYGITLDVQWDF